MSIVVFILSLFIVVTGALAIVAPRAADNLARIFDSRSGLYMATAIRLLLGAGLLLVANTSRTPMICRIFGVIIFAAGIFFPLIGLDRHRRMIKFWLSAGRTIQFVWGAAAFALGLFLIYAIW